MVTPNPTWFYGSIKPGPCLMQDSSDTFPCRKPVSEDRGNSQQYLWDDFTLCCPKVLISTKIPGSDSKCSSQVFLEIKRETDLSPLVIFYGPQVTFSVSKTKGCNGNFQASLAQFEGQTGVFCPSESALPALHFLHHQCPEPGDGAKGREWGWWLLFWGFSHPKYPQHPLQLLLPSITSTGKDTQCWENRRPQNPGTKAGWGVLVQIQQSGRKRRKISPK